MIRSSSLRFVFLASIATLSAVSVAACSSSSTPPGATPAADSGTSTDAALDAPPSDAPAGDAGPTYADPTTNDPIPSDLPVLFARTADPGAADVPPDLGCAGTPLPTSKGPLSDHVFHLSNLGGTDADRVHGARVELFFSGDPRGTPDVTAITKTGTTPSDPDDGTFVGSVPSSFVTSHVPKMTDYVETTQLDVDLREPQPHGLSDTPQSNADVIGALIGGSTYKPTPGKTRIIVSVLDCQNRPLAGVHLSLQLDGAVVPITTTDVRRNYFGDSRLPGNGKWTSRAGIVAFIEVPSNAKSMLLVGRAKLTATSAPTVVVSRPLLALPDGVITALVNPYAHAAL